MLRRPRACPPPHRQCLSHRRSPTYAKAARGNWPPTAQWKPWPPQPTGRLPISRVRAEPELETWPRPRPHRGNRSRPPRHEHAPRQEPAPRARPAPPWPDERCSDDPAFVRKVRIIHRLIIVTHHLANIESDNTARYPPSLQRLMDHLAWVIAPAFPSPDTAIRISGNAKNWMWTTLLILREHYEPCLARDPTLGGEAAG